MVAISIVSTNTNQLNLPILYAIPLPQRAVAAARNNVRGRKADIHDLKDAIFS